jgi:hypothetical protein
MKHFFKSLLVMTVKAPVIPLEEPRKPRKNKPTETTDDNAWLYEAFKAII